MKRRTFRNSAFLLAMLLATESALVHVSHEAGCGSSHDHHHGHSAHSDEASFVSHHHSAKADSCGECLACRYLAQRALYTTCETCEFSRPLRQSLQLDNTGSLQRPDHLSQCARGPPVLG